MGRFLSATVAALVAAVARAQPALTPGPVSADHVYRPGKFIWFELVSDEPFLTQRFYESVFGWTFRPVPRAPAAYMLIENGGDRIAGMFQQPPSAGGSRGARWIPVISVADAAQRSEKHTAELQSN